MEEEQPPVVCRLHQEFRVEQLHHDNTDVSCYFILLSRTDGQNKNENIFL